MLRDKGGHESLGFGVTAGHIQGGRDEREAADPEGGVIARFLHDRPVARFFAATAATIVGMHTAGRLARRGGMRLIDHAIAQSPTSPFWDETVRGAQRAQDILDELQGITQRTRSRRDGGIWDPDHDPLADWDPAQDRIAERRGFFFTEGEKERALRTGAQTPAEWTMRDELQQRLVRAGRRLPYELPAAYVTQRMFTDPILGIEQENRGSWYNPVDVIGDFAQRSLKDVAFAVLPFEGAVGATQQSWRRAMTLGTQAQTGWRKTAADFSIGMDASLEMLGHRASDLLERTAAVSSRSAGAAATAIRESAGQTSSLADELYKMRHGQGGVVGYFKRVKESGEYPGPFGQMYRFGAALAKGQSKNVPAGVTAHGEAFVSAGHTRLERLAGAINLQQRQGPGTSSFFDGAFYQGQSRKNYRTYLQAEMANRGVDSDVARLFADRADIRAMPTRTDETVDISQRIGFGKDEILEGNDKWLTAFKRRIEPEFRDDAQQITDNLINSVKAADARFMAGREAMDQSLERSWRHLYKEAIIPEARATLGTRRAAYADFDNTLGGDAGEWLVRRSAERLGVSTTTRMGNRRSTADLKDELGKLGFDAGNRSELRAFLVHKGDISKPWNPRGFNFLGLRPLSMQEGMEQGIFTPERHEQIAQLADSIQSSDWDSQVLNRIKVGGVYRSAAGNIVDFTGPGRTVRQAMDLIANEVQIPLIQLRPFQTLGYSISQNAANRPIMQFSHGGAQPGLRPGDQDADLGYLWFRGPGRSRKGSVTAVGAGGETRRLQGTYRPTSTDASSLEGRSVRVAYGDQGLRPQEEVTGWRRFFNVDPNQPDSILDWRRRFRDRRDDLRNTTRFASRWAAGDIDINADPAGFAEGFSLLDRLWSKASFGRNVLRAAEDVDEGIIRSLGKWTGKDDVVRDVHTANVTDLQRMMREAMEELPQQAGAVSSNAERLFRSSQRRFIKRWADIVEPREFDQGMPQPMRSVGLHRRIDAARLDFMRHLAMRQGLRQSPDEFARFTADMFSEIDLMRSRGVLGAAEVAEARAAVGAIQTNYLHIRMYDTALTPQDTRINVAREMFNQSDMRNLIAETGRAEMMTGGAIRRSGGRWYRRHLGTADQQFPGLEVDPFPDTVFVPTFGEAANRSPLRAIGSLLGWNTWADPQAFTQGGIASTHIVQRMNSPLQFFGMGLDPTRYSGPLHMLTKGMGLQRALPLFAAGATFMAADRTLGGLVTPRDEEGERVYRPLMLGSLGRVGVEIQAALTGAVPGGLSMSEKREELLHGEVPIRKGRFWPLGNTPWRGGQVQYYRPSWYRRLQAGHLYTDQTYGSPMERLAFGYDFSPLRPLDPYRFEREHYEDRPYPVTGDYFTGPWGPITPLLNNTIGRILKPRRMMHEEEVEFNLSRFQQVGAYGMAPPSTLLPVAGEPTIADAINAEQPEGPPMVALRGGGGMEGYGRNPIQARYAGAAGTPAYMSGSRAGGATSIGGTQGYMGAVGRPAYVSGSRAGREQTFASNDRYMQAARPAPPSAVATMSLVDTSFDRYPFMPPIRDYNPYETARPRIPANVLLASEPISPGNIAVSGSELGYTMQEFMGIYGFAFGALRENLGLGNQDMIPQRPVFQSASTAYGSARQFWDWNLGGLGDFPTPLEGEYANLEISEIVRRFIPKPRALNEVNPIANALGREHPWLPGPDYFHNFHWGDPFSSIPDGEMRLPGQGYERFNRLHPDETGRYGRIDRMKILADVAPYSNEFRQAAQEVRGAGMDPQTAAAYDEIMRRVEEMKRKHDFTEYKYKYSSPEEQDMGWGQFQARKLLEKMAHADTYLNQKFLPNRTATEDWERHNIYGASFPQWQSPIESYLEPALQRATQRNPIVATGTLAVVGGMFGATPQAKAVGRLIGGAAGLSSSMFGIGYEAVTGDRYIPGERRQELAIEEYTDILQYVKSTRAYNIARSQGDEGLAAQFQKQMQQTMYGADLYGNPADWAKAIPKRKREHFQAMLNAPIEERGRILSTAGRLERRIFQAAWGMPVEQRPDLEQYFQEHELPPPESEVWSPRVPMEMVKLKMIQNQGLDASQMGYYPQQLAEANLVNPAYPDYNEGTPGNVRMELERLLLSRGLTGDIREVRTPYSGVRAQVSAGVA